MTGGDYSQTEATYLYLFFLLCALFLFAPLCNDHSLRIRCKRRIEQRRWSVVLTDEDQRNSIFEAAARRIREDALSALELQRAKAATLSRIEEEKICAITDKFEDFAKDIQPGNFISAKEAGALDVTRLPFVDDDERETKLVKKETNDDPCEKCGEKNISSHGTISEDKRVADITSEGQCDFLRVPYPGVSRTQSEICVGSSSDRFVPNICSICLCNFSDQSDRIVWSSNPECVHVYHESCLGGWAKSFVTRGKRGLFMDEETTTAALLAFSMTRSDGPQTGLARTIETAGVNNTTEVASNPDLESGQALRDTATQLLKKCVFLPCPNCRQDFVLRLNSEDKQ